MTAPRQKMKSDQRGFSLIEMIASLVLIGMIAAIAGMGIVQMARQYLFTQQTGETAQVAQVAMARIVKELTLIRSCSASSATSISFDTPALTGRTIGWTGSNSGSFVTPILVNGQPLIENVQNFTLTYFNSYDGTATGTFSQTGTVMIGISFTVSGAGGTPTTFSGRVTVRN